MHRTSLAAAVLVLAACAQTPAPSPPRQPPSPVVPAPRIDAPIVVPDAPPPHDRRPRQVPVTVSDEVHPAAGPAEETARIARVVDGVAVAASRTGRHRLRMISTRQRVSANGVTLEFQAQLEPSALDVVMGGVLPVRRFVTTDGWELASPEQQWGVDPLSATVTSRGIDLARTHRGLRNLDLDARIFEIRARETIARGPFGPGEHEVRLGPFPVNVLVEDRVVSIVAWTDRAAERDWNGRHAQPLIRALDHNWALSAIEVRDADGQVLELVGIDGEGGASTGQFVSAFTSLGTGLASPVTVSLAIPASYRREDTSFYFEDLPLTTVEGP